MIPKFRLYDTVHEEMEYFEDYKDLSYMFKGLDADDGLYEEPMQSTGLLDINCKEVYEGDIVKVIVRDAEPQIIEDKILLGKIVYKYGSSDVAIEDNKLSGAIPMMHLGDHEFTFEILGNIFQHPHLLEADSHDR